jgi:hypothetical protein
VISKRVNADLRYALCHAARITSMKNALFRSWSTRQLKVRAREKGIFGIVQVNLAAKLLVIVRALMKDKEIFADGNMNYS